LNTLVRTRLRENSLTLAMLTFFALSLGGQILAGWAEFNREQAQDGAAQIDLPHYLTTGHFGEAVFENWESEFLQMGVLVILTARLRQKGSPESKSLHGQEPVDREPDQARPGAPWPVRVGGLVSILYSHSLGLGLLTLFAVCFVLHVITGAAAASAEELARGGQPVSPVEFLTTRTLWFQSFQNWQSEFLSIAALTVLSVFLREKGSAESKPVDAPQSETGGGP
jgi:uncharacterized protein DUF6766